MQKFTGGEYSFPDMNTECHPEGLVEDWKVTVSASLGPPLSLLHRGIRPFQPLLAVIIGTQREEQQKLQY